MTLTITATYAAIIALYYIAWSFNVTFTRIRTDISIGDGGNPSMLLAIRQHGNMAEYIPLALIMMAFAELGGLSSPWLHAAGLLLLGGRLLHPFGMAGRDALRIAGQSATYGAILIPAGAILLAQVI